MTNELHRLADSGDAPDARLEMIGDRDPYHALIGVELVERGAGMARCRLPVTAKVAGGVAGSVHGGVLSALVDIAALHAIPTVLAPGDTMAGTAELSISYLRPALTTVVYATARVLKKGRTLAVCDIDLTDAEGRLVAKGRVSYALRSAALAATPVRAVVLALLFLTLGLLAAPSRAQAQAAPLVEAELLLNDPRPCIPAAGQQSCDAAREALWNGESAAWAARGVVDGDARFRETVIFRVRAGDPAAIGAIARVLGVPYLKIVSLRFGRESAESPGEAIRIRNLGGGAQEMGGWTVRSPDRGRVGRFAPGLTLPPGGECIFGALPTPLPTATPPCGGGLEGADTWPDGGGVAVLYYDALDLPGDRTAYSADPAAQPPPPNLQVVRPFLDPTAIDPALAREISDSVDFLVRGIGLPSRPYLGDCQSVRPAVSGAYCTLVRPLNQAGDVVRVSIVPAGDVIFVRRAGRWSPITATFPGGA